MYGDATSFSIYIITFLMTNAYVLHVFLDISPQVDIMLTFHEKCHHLLCLSEEICSRADIIPCVIVTSTLDL